MVYPLIPTHGFMDIDTRQRELSQARHLAMSCVYAALLLYVGGMSLFDLIVLRL